MQPFIYPHHRGRYEYRCPEEECKETVTSWTPTVPVCPLHGLEMREVDC